MAMEDAVAGNGHCHRGTVGLLLRVLRPPRDLLSFTYSLWPPSLLAPAQRQRWPEEQLPALQCRQTCSGQAISAQGNCLQREAAGSETKTGRQPQVGALSLRPEKRLRLAFSGVPWRLESDFKVLGGPRACHTCRRLFTLAVNFSLHRVCHASPAAGALPALHASSRTSAGPTPSSRARSQQPLRPSAVS